jgi:HD-like signal output (HDOD) protein
MIMSPAIMDARIERSELLKVAQALPAAPRIFSRVSALLTDANSSIDEITSLLKRDPALTARILRVSNSVAYAGNEPVDSLDEAVQRVGFGDTYRIVGFATAAQVVQQHLGFYGVSAAQFRENALLTALIMERLADLAGLDTRSAYTAGLLRSIGKVALNRLGASRDGLDSYEDDGHGPLLDWEMNRCGTDNAQVAALVLDEWRFPAVTVQAVSGHYVPTESSPPLAKLLNVAAAASERCGHGWPGEWSYWDGQTKWLEAFQMGEDQVQEAIREALEGFGPVRAAVG